MDEYRVIKEIEKNPFHTQRSLADTLHISLGKANYVMGGLVEKGIVKARKLKNHPERIRWQYVLTPQGVRDKLSITRAYLDRRLREFDELRQEIRDLQRLVGTEATVDGESRAA